MNQVYFRFKQIKVAIIQGTGFLVDLEFIRTKGNTTGKWSKHSIFPHSNDWRICPVNLMACSLAWNFNAFDGEAKLFPQLPAGKGVAQYINTILKNAGKDELT
jgi:hypothetical protein